MLMSAGEVTGLNMSALKNIFAAEMTKGEREIESKHISGAFASGRNLFFKNQSEQKQKSNKWAQ